MLPTARSHLTAIDFGLGFRALITISGTMPAVHTDWNPLPTALPWKLVAGARAREDAS